METNTETTTSSTIGLCQSLIADLLTKHPHRWTNEDYKRFREYRKTLPSDKEAEFKESLVKFNKRWNLPADGGTKYVTQEQFDHATGCYFGSAIDEMGLTSEARCLYTHLVRRANGSNETEVKRWRQGKLRRSAKCGRRSICRWCGLSPATVEKATKELEEVKLITVERDRKKRMTNIYTLLPPSVWCTWLEVGERPPF
jgi:DNA-binding transcriptional ArsR family regulator